jgi:hypothetical protein
MEHRFSRGYADRADLTAMRSGAGLFTDGRYGVAGLSHDGRELVRRELETLPDYPYLHSVAQIERITKVCGLSPIHFDRPLAKVGSQPGGHYTALAVAETVLLEGFHLRRVKHTPTRMFRRHQ